MFRTLRNLACGVDFFIFNPLNPPTPLAPPRFYRDVPLIRGKPLSGGLINQLRKS